MITTSLVSSENGFAQIGDMQYLNKDGEMYASIRHEELIKGKKKPRRWRQHFI